MINLWGTLKNWVVDFAGHPGDQPNSPDSQSPVVISWVPDLALVRALYGGFRTLYEQRALFLPRHPKEDAQDYLIRASRPTFYNAFARTIRALTGIAFRQPPVPEGVPAEILTLYNDDIDNKGTAGDMFLRHVFLDALTTGLAGILVEMPVLDGEDRTRADELDAGIRPYWTMYRKDDVVSFRVEVEDGKTYLAQLVLCETIQQPVGEYGVKHIDHLRVFKRLPAIPGATAEATITLETWEKNKAGKWMSLGTQDLPAVQEIPFAPIYTEHTDFMDARPPLLDLANLNLLHYQMWSDLAHAAHLANVPFLFGIGIDQEELTIGPNLAVLVKGGDASTTLRWVETTGASLGSTRALLSDIEEQMANLGLSMLQRKSRAAETAQKSVLDRTEQDATLGAVIGDLENGVEQALYWTAVYLGMGATNPKVGGRLNFSRNFTLDAPVPGEFAPPQAPAEPTPAGVTNNPKTTTVTPPAPTPVPKP